MAFSFGDSFDLYTTTADMVPSYWDSNVTSASLVTGRFPGSRGIQMSSGTAFTKNSGANDPVHHIVSAFIGTASAAQGHAFTLMDGATAQCTVLIQTNGTILLQAGALGGATLATYSAGLLLSTWYGLEIEVVINATTGSFAVRKNGNTVNDFSATGLNTQASANAYANALKFTANINSGAVTDDLFWRSGASAGTWLGDLRCLTRMPITDQSVQFSKTPASPTPQTPFAANGVTNSSATSAWYTPVVAAYDATLGSLTVSINAGFTGNLKCTLFADNGSNAPAAIIASLPTLANPVAGNNTLTFGSPPTLVRGVKYWIGFSADGVYTNAYNIATNQGFGSTTAYAAFPVPNPVSSGFAPAVVITLSLTIGNHSLVAEPQEDGLASYVFDSNPGDQDFYGLPAGSTFTSTPYSTVAVITRGFMQKGDAGTRTAAVKLKSGATTVATPTLVLSNTVWQWAWRQDLTDPNTGAAWTSAAVDALQLGPTVVA